MLVTTITMCRACDAEFVNLQESPAGFASTKIGALVSLLRESRVKKGGSVLV